MGVFDLVQEIDDLLVNLSFIPDVLQMTIENLCLDEEMTEDQVFDFVGRRRELGNILVLTRNMISETLEKLDDVTGRALKSEHSIKRAAGQ